MPHEARPTAEVPEAQFGPTSRRHEVEREFIANALYLGIVLYAALAVVPPNHLPPDGETHPPLSGDLAETFRCVHSPSQGGLSRR